MFMDAIKPTDINVRTFPDPVLKVFNTLIKENYVDGRAEVRWSEAMGRLIAGGLKEDDIISNRYLEVREVYQRAGWDVSVGKYPDRYIFRAQ